MTDRVVQMAVKLVIEPLFEADFLPCSFGFRPERSSLQAIRLIDDHLRRGYHWVVDVDLKSYFDTIPHDRLLELVGRRVTDRKIIRLIRHCLFTDNNGPNIVSVELVSQNGRLDMRHQDGVNVLYADLHANHRKRGSFSHTTWRTPFWSPNPDYANKDE